MEKIILPGSETLVDIIHNTFYLYTMEKNV